MAITFIQEGHNDDVAGTPTVSLLVTPGAGITAGHTLVVFVGNRTSGQTTPQVTDVKITGGASLTQATPINDPNDQRDSLDMWYVLSCAAGASITVTLAHDSTVAAVMLEYSGVAAIGTIPAAVSGLGGARSISQLAADANNYFVAGFSDASSVAGFTKTSGDNTRLSAFQNNQGSIFIAAIDDTDATATTLTGAYTITTPIQYLAQGIELRSTTGGGGGGTPIIVARSPIPVPGPRRTQIIMT